MSRLPSINKSKYNKDDKFAWVDSQWKKFMTEQKEHKAMIKQLQEDLGTCTENFQRQRKQMEGLVARVPSQYLTEAGIRSDKWRIEQFNRNRPVEDQVKTIEEMDEKIKEIFNFGVSDE